MSSDASEILARSAERYASCRSYRDEGVVTTIFHRFRKRTERRPFSTRFDRATGFVFEFRSRLGEEEWDQCAVWLQDGRHPNMWWSVRPVIEHTGTLGRGIAGATGISGGSACRVPALLMPDLFGRRSDEAAGEARVIESADAADQGCVVIERPCRTGSVEQIWIELSSLLIRRVVEPRHALAMSPDVTAHSLAALEKHMAPDAAAALVKQMAETPSETETITTYDAAFDVPLNPADLVFTPPPGPWPRVD